MTYFDYAASSPISNKALQTYIESSQKYYANSSSLHSYGYGASSLLEYCRNTIASLLKINPHGIYFTSGGTEANILCVQSILNGLPKNKRKIIISPLEHSSLHNAISLWKEKGYEVIITPLTNEGTIDIQQFENMLTSEVAIVIIQHINSETGIIQPMKQIGELTKKHKIHWHTDCVQSVGKYDLYIEEWGVTSFSSSAHKFYGPKGIGFAYINPSVLWKSDIPGITHEKGFRAGTVPVPLIAAMTTALQESYEEKEVRVTHLLELHNECRKLLQPLQVLTPTTEFAPHIMGILLPNMEGQWAMLECDRRGIAISTGSACLVGMNEPSHAVTALGIDGEHAKSFIRASFGIHTTKEDILLLTSTLHKIVEDVEARKQQV